MADIRDHIRRGWQYLNGWLVQGQKKIKPSRMMPSRLGTPQWNPRTDATAVKLGAVFVSANHYRHPSGFWMDKNGAIKPDEQCPVCGSEGDFRMLRVYDWKTGRTTGWAACPRCNSVPL